MRTPRRTEPHQLTVRAIRTLLRVALATGVSITLATSSATGDELTVRRQQVTAQLSQSQRELAESSRELQQAAAAVVAAQTRLTAAQAQLVATRGQLAEAKVADVKLATKLRKAQAELDRARAAVAAGQRELDGQKRVAGNVVRDQYQQQTNLLPLAVLLADQSAGDLQTRLQWGTTMVDSTAAQIDRLTVLQQALTEQRNKQAELERQVAADRAAAAANLVRKRVLERRATAETASVATLVRQRTAAERAAASAVAADKLEVVALDRERVSVEQRIAKRIAAAKARAARKAAAARAARLRAQQAAAAHRAHLMAVAKRASKAAAAERARQADSKRGDRSTVQAPSRKKQKAKSQQPKPRQQKAKQRSANQSRSTGHGFIYPVNGPITSPYGRRFHPVLHIWKLHDGTDFGGGCGAPIRAAYSGRVAERYYNGAYGNRLMIDHGVVDGRYVTTGYNHAQRYRVSVGERVTRGEVIGYVGSTGYSTGCHLHLMVWLNGGRVNPMSWF